MKAYLIVTGTLFGLVSLLHIWRIIAEWHGFRTELWAWAGGSVLTGILSIWAWQLLFQIKQNQQMY
jgi:hypothetical protein